MLFICDIVAVRFCDSGHLIALRNFNIEFTFQQSNYLNLLKIKIPKENALRDLLNYTLKNIFLRYKKYSINQPVSTNVIEPTTG